SRRCDRARGSASTTTRFMAAGSASRLRNWQRSGRRGGSDEQQASRTGPRSRTAINHFQRALRLAPAGRVGDNSPAGRAWQRLYHADEPRLPVKTMLYSASRHDFRACRAALESYAAVVRQREQRAWVQFSPAQIGIRRPFDDPFGCGAQNRLGWFVDRDGRETAGVAVLDVEAHQV